LDDALRALTRAVELAPNDPEAVSNLGEILEQQGRFDEALLRGLQTVALEPTNAYDRAQVGNMYWKLDDLPRAEAWARQAIRLEPDGLLPNIVTAQLQARRGEYREASSTIDVLLRGGEIWPHEWAGYFELLRGDAAAAARHYRQAAGGAPPAQPERVFAGYAYLKSGDEPRARRVLDRVQRDARAAIQRGGAGPTPYVDLARLAAMRGQHDEAMALLQRAVMKEGYRDVLALDPTLASLRKDARFRRLVANVQTQVDSMRALAVGTTE
jgi:tetratricopeptide (TPR) repeat protein